MNKKTETSKSKIALIVSLITIISVIKFYTLGYFMPELDNIVKGIGVLLIFSSIALVGHRIYLISQLIRTVGVK